MEAILLTGGASQPRATGLARGEDWRSAAACQATDPDLFFPVSGSGKSLEQVERAKAICAACPVRRDCLAFALRIGQADGIWGGLTEEERRRPAPVSPGERPARTPDGPAPLATAAWPGELIEGQVRAARSACDRMTVAALQNLSDSVEEASRMPSQPGWARKAAAYAGTFRLLAEVTGDRAPDGAAGFVRDLMTAVGTRGERDDRQRTTPSAGAPAHRQRRPCSTRTDQPPERSALHVTPQRGFAASGPQRATRCGPGLSCFGDQPVLNETS